MRGPKGEPGFPVPWPGCWERTARPLHSVETAAWLCADSTILQVRTDSFNDSSNAGDGRNALPAGRI